MPNSIQINEQMFLLVGTAVALTCLVYGIILTRRAMQRRSTPAFREIQASMSALEQAEQIVRLAWEDSEEEEEWKL